MQPTLLPCSHSRHKGHAAARGYCLQTLSTCAASTQLGKHRSYNGRGGRGLLPTNPAPPLNSCLSHRAISPHSLSWIKHSWGQKGPVPTSVQAATQLWLQGCGTSLAPSQAKPISTTRSKYPAYSGCCSPSSAANTMSSRSTHRTFSGCLPSSAVNTSRVLGPQRS